MKVIAFAAQAQAGAFKARGAKKGAPAAQPVAVTAKRAPATTPRRVAPKKNSRVATKARPDDLTPDPAPKKKAGKKKGKEDEDDVIVVDED